MGPSLAGIFVDVAGFEWTVTYVAFMCGAEVRSWGGGGVTGREGEGRGEAGEGRGEGGDGREGQGRGGEGGGREWAREWEGQGIGEGRGGVRR